MKIYSVKNDFNQEFKLELRKIVMEAIAQSLLFTETS